MSDKNLLQILNEDQALAAEEESLKSRLSEVQAQRKALALAAESEIDHLDLARDPAISKGGQQFVVVEVDGTLIAVHLLDIHTQAGPGWEPSTPPLSFLNVQKL